MQSSQQSPGKMSFEEAHETSKKTSHIDTGKEDLRLRVQHRQVPRMCFLHMGRKDASEARMK